MAGLPISPSILLMDYLQTHVDSNIINPDNVVVGKLEAEQLAVGGVQLSDAGQPKVEERSVWVRAQIRALAPTQGQSDIMGRHIWEICHYKNRVLATMHREGDPTDGNQYLIHSLNVSAGPTHHLDSKITWETLQFAEMMVGLTPAVSAGV